MYPTKKQIMEVEQKFKPEVIKMIKDWKDYWKLTDKTNEKEKFNNLMILALCLSKIYEKPVKIKYAPDIPSCCYDTVNKIIFINSSTSIISLLHEFAHHLFGHSELKACRWSVWLFKKTFPASFAKLKWKGHLLCKTI